jgi:hypothetical protein
MKPCISVGLLKVKVVAVLRVMKTLLELMLVLPLWVRAGPEGITGVLFLLTGGITVVLGVVGAAVDLQTEGCPLQANPLWILHLTHPGEDDAPVSHCSFPTINPSPHWGTQTPWALGVNPVVAQVMHSLADLQVVHELLQATHPLSWSKYCPLAQLIGFICSFWHTPYVSM